MIKCLLVLVGDVNDDKSYISRIYNQKKQVFEREKPQCIVLLPSYSSRQWAEKLKGDIERDYQKKYYFYDIISPEQEVDIANKPDECLKYFEKVWTKVKADFDKAQLNDVEILCDYTSGTKVMSVCLFMLALRKQFGKLIYVYSKDRRAEGRNAVAEEQYTEYTTVGYVRDSVVLEQAKNLFKKGQFKAVEELMDQNFVENEQLRLQLLSLAKFYSAWDRFDYNNVDMNLDNSGFIKINVSEKVKDFIGQLKNSRIMDMAEKYPEKAKYCINLFVDVYSNALRRFKQGQFEDFGIRIYRLAELLGQIRLFQLGQNPVDNDREQCIKSLQNSNDNRVLEFANSLHLLGVGSIRNQGVLIHGFRTQIGNNSQALMDVLKEEKDLFYDILQYSILQIRSFKELFEDLEKAFEFND